MSAAASTTAAKPPAAGQNTAIRNTALAEIFSKAMTASKNLGKGLGTTAAGATFRLGSQIMTEENGSYLMNVVFWLLLYGFAIFIVALFVHYSITPIFRFYPGQQGYIGVPGTSDDKVYWNERAQPQALTIAPFLGISGENPTVTRSGTVESSDDLSSYNFVNDFSFTIDVLLRKLNENDSHLEGGQVLLIKAGRPLQHPTATPQRLYYPSEIFNKETGDGYVGQNKQNILDYYKARASMILWVSDTNDLRVTFFSGTTPNQVSTRAIKNIPLYQPFRIGLVVEKKTFTLYLNGKQVFQGMNTGALEYNNYSSSGSFSRTNPESKIGFTNKESQVFYSPPEWQATGTKAIFLQNFHLWPRTISYTELTHAKPALATVPDFDAPQEVTKLCVR